jgi:hypothetical protein
MTILRERQCSPREFEGKILKAETHGELYDEKV